MTQSLYHSVQDLLLAPALYFLPRTTLSGGSALRSDFASTLYKALYFRCADFFCQALVAWPAGVSSLVARNVERGGGRWRLCEVASLVARRWERGDGCRLGWVGVAHCGCELLLPEDSMRIIQYFADPKDRRK
jgi:hypothetical protein